jgi:hypothetical protein
MPMELHLKDGRVLFIDTLTSDGQREGHFTQVQVREAAQPLQDIEPEDE